MGRILTILFSIVILGGLVSMCSSSPKQKHIAELQKNIKPDLIKKYNLPPDTVIEFGDGGAYQYATGHGIGVSDYFYARWLDKNTKKWRTVKCDRGRTYVGRCIENVMFQDYQ